MKKYLLSLILVTFVGWSAAFGQCTPDPQYTSPGIYPDSATNLAPGFGGVAYSELVTLVIPADTVVEIIPGFPQTLTMDSINLTNVTGLPPGFTYDCVPNSCSFPGDASHCLVITGNPTPADIGNYPLDVELDAYVGGTGVPVPTTVGYYFIDIFDSAVMSVPSEEMLDFILFQNQPNPARGNTQIKFSSRMPGMYTLEVIDILGNQVINRNVKATQGLNQVNLDASTLRQGIYLYSLSNGKTTQTLRMVVNK